MTRDREPTRLSELRGDGPDGLRRALGDARRSAPDGAARARIAAGLRATLGMPPGSALGTRAARDSVWRPLAITGGVATATVAAVLALRAVMSPPYAPPAPAPAIVEIARAAPAAAVPAPPALSPAPALEPAAPAPAAAANQAVLSSRLPSRPALPATRRAPRPSLAARHASIPSEGELLHRAQQALRDDPAGGLALARQHAALYPAGALAQERDVIAVEALSRLGRRDEAHAAAQAFLAQHPDSPHRGRVESLLLR
jgi:hypothetical protein